MRGMKGEILQSIVFSVIVGIVFFASMVLIYQQEQGLNADLKAAVFQPEYLERHGQEAIKGLASRAKEQIGRVMASGCLKKAYTEFEALWNQECAEKGLEDRCDLPRDIADPLLKGYEQLKNSCYEK